MYSAYRVYSEDNIRQIQMIRKAQSLGFRLSELEPVLRAGRDAPDWCGLLRQLEQKRASIRRDIQKLKQLDAQLGRIMDEIQGCPSNVSPLDLGQCGPAQGAARSPAKQRSSANA